MIKAIAILLLLTACAPFHHQTDLAANRDGRYNSVALYLGKQCVKCGEEE
jgi:hypothetical protein